LSAALDGPAPHTATFRDIAVLPYGAWRPAVPGGRLDGGPVFPDDAPEWVHMPLRGATSWARGPSALPAGAEPPPAIAGDFLFAGPLVNHFGHMIGEFLHRLWPLATMPALTPVFVATPHATALPRYLADYLALIGAPEPLVIDRPARLANMLVAEPGRVLGRVCPAGHGRRMGAMLPPALLDPPGQARDLAILRGHLQTGRCTGEAWLEAALAERGYRAFRPERHSIAEQIAALAGAERIVASEGSALHLFDLLPPVRARIAVLARGPSSRLAETCLAEKAPGYLTFRPRFLVGSLALSNARSNALAWVEPGGFLDLLAAEGFIAAAPATRFAAEPGLLEADIGAYAAHWRRRRDGGAAEAFAAAALAACRADRPDPGLRATLRARSGDP